MNFFDGVLREVAGGMGLSMPVRSGASSQARRDARLPALGPATVAVRPEKLKLDDQPSTDPADNNLQGRLTARAYLGDRNHYYVEVDGLEKPLAVAAQNARRKRAQAIQPARRSG